MLQFDSISLSTSVFIKHSTGCWIIITDQFIAHIKVLSDSICCPIIRDGLIITSYRICRQHRSRCRIFIGHRGFFRISLIINLYIWTEIRPTHRITTRNTGWVSRITSNRRWINGLKTTSHGPIISQPIRVDDCAINFIHRDVTTKINRLNIVRFSSATILV